MVAPFLVRPLFYLGEKVHNQRVMFRARVPGLGLLGGSERRRQAQVRLTGIIVAGVLGSLTAAAPAQAGKSAAAILRVPEAEMARRVVSRVQPDRTMAGEAVSGTVVLSEVVDREGFIEHISVLSGPQPARAAAVFAARQWSYKPYVVDGQAVAVETTATLDFGGDGADSTKATLAVAAASETPANGGHPRMGKENPAAAPRLIASAEAVGPLPSSGRPAYRSTGGPHAVLETAPAVLLPAAVPLTASATTSSRMTSQWRLARRVGPVYPAAAEVAGIEGIVVVEGVVKRDGTLHSVTAVSGPKELRQAAVDAAAQWEFQPNHAGDPQDTPVRESIEFLLRGPAHVPAEVMAGRIERSVQPEYPADAQAAGVTGSVVVHVLVDRQGEVEKAAAVSGPALLREAALAAVKQWTWKPFLRNGVDQEVDTTVVVAFTMQWAGVQ